MRRRDGAKHAVQCLDLGDVSHAEQVVALHRTMSAGVRTCESRITAAGTQSDGHHLVHRLPATSESTGRVASSRAACPSASSSSWTTTWTSTPGSKFSQRGRPMARSRRSPSAPPREARGAQRRGLMRRRDTEVTASGRACPRRCSLSVPLSSSRMVANRAARRWRLRADADPLVPPSAPCVLPLATARA